MPTLDQATKSQCVTHVLCSCRPPSKVYMYALGALYCIASIVVDFLGIFSPFSPSVFPLYCFYTVLVLTAYSVTRILYLGWANVAWCTLGLGKGSCWTCGAPCKCAPPPWTSDFPPQIHVSPLSLARTFRRPLILSATGPFFTHYSKQKKWLGKLRQNAVRMCLGCMVAAAITTASVNLCCR